MKDKFINYAQEVGIRYAVSWGKYERLSLAVLELWLLQSQIPYDISVVRVYYNKA